MGEEKERADVECATIVPLIVINTLVIIYEVVLG